MSDYINDLKYKSDNYIFILVYIDMQYEEVFIAIRIDKENAKYLDELISHLTLRGNKVTKKELIGKLIKEALIAESLKNSNELNSLESDLAWKGLKDVFKLGISDLSEKVDDLLYGEE